MTFSVYRKMTSHDNTVYALSLQMSTLVYDRCSYHGWPYAENSSVCTCDQHAKLLDEVMNSIAILHAVRQHFEFDVQLASNGTFYRVCTTAEEAAQWVEKMNAHYKRHPVGCMDGNDCVRVFTHGGACQWGFLFQPSIPFVDGLIAKMRTQISYDYRWFSARHWNVDEGFTVVRH